MASIPRVLLPVVLLPSVVAAQQGDGTDVAVQAHVFKPAKVEATPERVAGLRVADGFSIAPFATGLKNVRMLAVADDGTVYATRREEGDVIMLRDADRDGRADAAPVVVAHRPGLHGIALHDGRAYLAAVKEIFVADILPDGRFGELEMLVGDLPDGGQHPNRTLAMGPDGKLYVSIGSSCNACNETNPEHAALLQMSPDGKTRTIFASGLRNLIGFGWHPRSGELWGMDHGIDDLGNDVQPEELNRVEHGRKYGWPHVHGAGAIHPQTTPPGGVSKEEWKRESTPMVLGYTAHAAPMQMTFANAAFPTGHRNDAFVAMRGSWNRKPASGYEVVRVKFDADGRPTGFETFVSGFLVDNGRAHFARPAGLAATGDGALLLGDDANGVIYRIAPRQQATAAAAPGPGAAPASAMRGQSAQGNGVPLALARLDAARPAPLRVASTSFANGAPIPARHSEYADGVSPELHWDAVDGARSYLVVMEDPDATGTTPFVHWVAWNIPATTTALPEGLQEQPRLTEPEGLLQGRTSKGSVAYFGPRPPPGDPPHHYHVQVFALDTMLDVPAGASRDRVLEAAKGHVLAKGELVGTYRQAAAPPK